MDRHPNRCSTYCFMLSQQEAALNLVNTSFLSRQWDNRSEQPITLICSMPPKHTVHINNITPIFIRTGALCEYAWFGFIKNLAVDVLLGTFFLDCYIREIFASEREIVLLHSCSVSILSSSEKTGSLFSDTFFSNIDSAHAAKFGEVNNDMCESITSIECLVK